MLHLKEIRYVHIVHGKAVNHEQDMLSHHMDKKHNELYH